MKRKRILYITHVKITFLAIDLKLLSDRYDVIPYCLGPRLSGFGFLLNMASLVIFILRHGWRADAMIAWFGDYHSAVMTFLGRLMGAKVIIFAGGQEAICYPELRKGVYLKKLRGSFVKYALRNASVVVPNHSSLLFHENYYYTPDGKKDGIRYYVRNFKTPVTIIPNGIDTGKYYRDPRIPKEANRILTVGTMVSTYDFINKGFDLFLELARRNPDLQFTLVGIKQHFMPWIEETYHISEIRNLELVFFFCPDEVLFMHYNKARVYIQASITEGMPNTLSEAMLCECIPVGSNVNGIPDAMGETGVIVYHRSVDELDQAIHQALLMDTGPLAREYTLENFTIGKRKERLMKLLDEIL